MSELLKTERLGVSWAIIEKNDQVLIIRKPGQFQWSLPGGKARPGEGPRKTLLRELNEQFTGWQLVAPLVILRHLERTSINAGEQFYISRPTTVFLAQIDGIMVPNRRRIDDVHWVDPIAEDLEYDLPCQAVRSIISLRIKRAKLIPGPPKILD